MTAAALLDTRGLARYLDVHYKTAQKLIASGAIPATNIGGKGTGARWRVKPADVDLWLATCPTNAA